jgi:phosphoribosylformylglycinamidine synthase
MAATNNLNFGNPERPAIMRQIVEAIEGIGEACRFFETPITGGNVSLYNETLGEPIHPSPVMGIVGLMKTEAPAGISFRAPGRSVILLGGLGSCEPVHFGGTQYAHVILKDIWGLPPALDMDYEKRVQAAIREVVNAGLAESAHDISDGGLAVALAECSYAGTGADIRLDSELRPEFLLFHEGPSRIVVSTASPGRVREIAESHGVNAIEIGKTQPDRLAIAHRGAKLVSVEVDSLRGAWENALPELLNVQRPAP